MENEPVSMETASLSHQHPIPSAKQGRGGMGARFSPDAGVLAPMPAGFSAWPPTASAASREGAKSVAHLSLAQPFSAIFHPKKQHWGQTQPAAGSASPWSPDKSRYQGNAKHTE